MTEITKLIRHRELLMHLWAGWAVHWVGGPHERHSYLATRRERP